MRVSGLCVCVGGVVLCNLDWELVLKLKFSNCLKTAIPIKYV